MINFMTWGANSISHMLNFLNLEILFSTVEQISYRMSTKIVNFMIPREGGESV